MSFEFSKVVDLDVACNAGHRSSRRFADNNDVIFCLALFRGLVNEFKELWEKESMGDDGTVGVRFKDGGKDARLGECVGLDAVGCETEVGDDELEAVVEKEENRGGVGLYELETQESSGKGSSTVLEMRVGKLVGGRFVSSERGVGVERRTLVDQRVRGASISGRTKSRRIWTSLEGLRGN